MATIKGYTNIEQSRKLAEILPLESADMYYPWYIEEDRDNIKSGHRISIPSVGNFIHKVNILPCWSLAALLEQLDDNIADDDGNDWQLEINKEDGQYYLNYHDRWGNEDDIETDYYDDLVDACYKMVLKLHELKML